MQKSIFISWLKYDGRSAVLAKGLDIPIFFLHCGPRKKWFWVPYRYLNLSIRTFFLLLREKPDTIFVEVPPTPSAIIIYVYCILFHAQFIMDMHSGSLFAPWNKLFWLQKFLSKRALVTISHNYEVEDYLTKLNLKTIRIGYVPEDNHEIEDYPLHERFNIAIPCSFEADEPIEEMILAAKRVPEIDFYFTGNPKQKLPDYLVNRPPNCHLTGFLKSEQYNGLIKGSDVVIDLTTRDSTILMGGFEAIYFEKPFITSNWPILKRSFTSGTIHIDNSSESIYQAVMEVNKDYQKYKIGIIQLKKIVYEDFNHQVNLLKSIMN